MDDQIIVVEPTTLPWERQPGEPQRWWMRFHDFMMLGPTRSLIATMRLNKKRSGARGYWSNKAIQWDWRRRAELYDQHMAEVEEQMRFDTMHAGLALDWQRVQTLRKIADGEAEILLETQAEVRRDKMGVNESLTKRYTAMAGSLAKNLEAIAQETGGRVKRVSVRKELRDYAVELARTQGYDEKVAIEIADMMALEGPQT